MHKPASSKISALARWIGWSSINYRNSEIIIASVGGLIALLILWRTSQALLGEVSTFVLVPSMGATAVLVFAAPHSPLTQPWPIFGGHVISALLGVTCHLFIPDRGLAAACAVGFALIAMYRFRCIHPPGGATALTAVLGGENIQSLGYLYALTPVALNCLILITWGVMYNFCFPWRRFPMAMAHSHAPLPKNQAIPQITREHIISAIEKQRALVDVSVPELTEIVESALEAALAERATTHPALQIGKAYGNNRPGPEWSIRKLIGERPSDIAEFDLVVYEIIEGAGRGRTDSCQRKAFEAWACVEIHSKGSRAS